MAQTPISNSQASLALTQYFPLNGVFPSRDGGGTGFFLGEIGTFAGNFNPAGGTGANGQLLPIAQNTAVFSLIGTSYGGNGMTNFALPNLNGVTMIGAGQGLGLSPETLGGPVGSSTVTLGFPQTPPDIGGQSQPFNNYQPSLPIIYEIGTVGVFPSQGGGSPRLDTLGMVMAFAGNFDAGGFMACDGRLLSIAQNDALFTILGTTYGGDGITTFALPDLRGRDIIGSSASDPVGTTVGQENVSLSNAQTPNGLGNAVTPFDNRQPSLSMEYLIAVQGIFPSQGGGGQDFTTPFLGQIVNFAGGFVPSGWALCDGRLLQINQNQALFALLGTQYGGNGTTTFALPDLRDKTVVGSGNGQPVGTVTGANSVTITTAQLPNTPPVITSNGGGNTASITMVTSQTLVTTVTATDIDAGQTLTYAITGGEDQALFHVTNGNQLSFITAPDLNALPSTGATPGYQVGVTVSDAHGGFTSQQITVNVSANPHLSSGAVSYFDAIGGVYVDLPTQLGRRADAGGSYLLGPASVTPIATDQLTGVHTVTGSSFNDLFVGDTGTDLLSGGGGNDLLYGNTSQAAADNTGHTTLDGGAGANALYGSSAFTTFIAGDTNGGFDQIWGGASKMAGVLGFTNNTLSYATVAAGKSVYVDLLNGHDGYLNSGAHNNGVYTFEDSIANVPNVIGSSGGDIIIADNGADRIQGGGGADALYAGGGADTFIYATYGDSNTVNGYDTIVGFKIGTDKIDLSALHTDAAHLLIDTVGTGNSLYVETTPGTFNANTDLALIVNTSAAGGLHASDFVF
jgi:microcystin-dependent protein